MGFKGRHREHVYPATAPTAFVRYVVTDKGNPKEGKPWKEGVGDLLLVTVPGLVDLGVEVGS